MAHLAMSLLGTFEATLDSLQIEGLSSDRLRALLAYLAVEREREHPREQVAALLWPERPDQEALSALRYALSNLHAALADRRASSPFLLVTRTSVQFNTASDYWLDVAEFGDLAGRSDVASLERAASLYRGPFLHGLSVGDSPAFDDWVLLKDEEYRRIALSVLRRLASLHLARANYAEASRWARRQLELEPYREQAHRQLMTALALGGERSAALAHYEACRRLLADELGCEPEDETQALCVQIRDGTLREPQPVPAILSAAESSTSARARPSLPFVARERELARLSALLDRAVAGDGGLVLIAGEAGSGKTALLDEVAREASGACGNLIALRGSCSAHGGAGDPYLPFREILQALAGDVEGKRAGGALSPEQARRVWEVLPSVGAALAEHGPDLIDSFVPGEALLRRLEGFATPAGAAHWQARLREIIGRGEKERAPGPGSGLASPAPHADLFAQVTQVLHTVSLQRPLLLEVDDLQWADSGTAALLFHLGRRLAGSRILLACAFRPEALESADPKGLPTPLGSLLRELVREWGDVVVDLDRADGRAFVEAYVDSEPNCLGPAFRRTLYDHTAGNPLFTVELLRSFEREGALVRDDGGQLVEAPSLDWERWPPRVEAVIARHLAALPDEDRTLLRAASVQGERFSAEVAARALGWDEAAAVRRLSGALSTRHRLVDAVSLERLATSGQRLSCYRFRHSLLQRGAYRSLDDVARAGLHEATARALEEMYATEEEKPQSLAPDLAWHFEAAGLPLKAARYRLEAGRWAARLVAYDAAVTHLERGLALLESIPASREQLRLELALCSALVNPAWLEGGWKAPTFTRALERLSRLVQDPALQDDPQRLAALTILAAATTGAADPARGRLVGEQLLSMADDADQQTLMLAHWILGLSDWSQGQPVAAREQLERALALYNSEIGSSLSVTLAGDPGMTGDSALAYTVWLLGYPDQSRARFREVLARAQATGQLSNAAHAHLWAGTAHLLLGRDATAARRHAQAVQPFVGGGQFYGAWAELLTVPRGAARPEPARNGDLSEPPPALQTLQSGLGQAARLLAQAKTCAAAGQVEMGLQAVDQALAWIERTGMRIMEVEAWRTRGELLFLVHGPDSDSSEAEACFRRALEVARGQQARWLELQAAVSLARLWQAQGRRDEARELLAPIYNWFTEGFDTVDLIKAKALLDELQ